MVVDYDEDNDFPSLRNLSTVCDIVLSVTDQDIWELFCLWQIYIYGDCFVCCIQDIWDLFCLL